MCMSMPVASSGHSVDSLRNPYPQVNPAELKALFEFLDPDGSGGIEFRELQLALRQARSPRRVDEAHAQVVYELQQQMSGLQSQMRELLSGLQDQMQRLNAHVQVHASSSSVSHRCVRGRDECRSACSCALSP